MERIDEKLLQPKVDHTPAELDGPSRCLLLAADLIERNGLCQHGMYGSDGSGCIIVAFARTKANDEEGAEARKRLRALIPSIPSTYYDLVRWNEDSGVTQSEVVAKMRVAALSA